MLGALLAALAARCLSPWLWIAAAIPLLAGVWTEARTSDGLLTMRYLRTRRRSLLLTGAGAAAFTAGLALRSLSAAFGAGLIVSGAGFFLGGGGALAWHYVATYAGNRIVTLSDEDW